MNTTSGTLRLDTGAVSAQLLSKAGRQLQQECDDELAQQGLTGLGAGGILVTRPAKLRCKAVYHTVCCSYTGAKSETVSSWIGVKINMFTFYLISDINFMTIFLWERGFLTLGPYRKPLPYAPMGGKYLSHLLRVKWKYNYCSITMSDNMSTGLIQYWVFFSAFIDTSNDCSATSKSNRNEIHSVSGHRYRRSSVPSQDCS